MTAAGRLVTSDNLTTAKSANARTHQRRRLAVQRLVNAVLRTLSETKGAMTRTITVDATGTVEIVAGILATRDNSHIVRPANVWTHQRQVPRKSVVEPARPPRGKVMDAAMMEITIAVATGTLATAAAKAATSTSLITAQSVCAKIPRSRKSVRKAANVVSLPTWAMDVAMMKTTIAAVIGTRVIAAGNPATNTNFRTAQNASVWIRTS